MAKPERMPDPQANDPAKTPPPIDPKLGQAEPRNPASNPATQQSVSGGSMLLIAAIVVVLAVIAYFIFFPGVANTPVEPEGQTTTEPAAPATPAPETTAPTAPAAPATPEPQSTAPTAPRPHRNRRRPTHRQQHRNRSRTLQPNPHLHRHSRRLRNSAQAADAKKARQMAGLGIFEIAPAQPSFASSDTLMAPSALETGQPALACSASSLNFAASMPGTVPTSVKALSVISKPPPAAGP